MRSAPRWIAAAVGAVGQDLDLLGREQAGKEEVAVPIEVLELGRRHGVRIHQQLTVCGHRQVEPLAVGPPRAIELCRQRQPGGVGAVMASGSARCIQEGKETRCPT